MPAFFRKAGRAVSIAKWHRTPERISLYITLPVSCAETVLQPDQRFLDDIVFTQTALSEKAGNRRDIPRMGGVAGHFIAFPSPQFHRLFSCLKPGLFRKNALHAGAHCPFR